MYGFRRRLINILSSILVVMTMCFAFLSLVLIVFNFTYIKTDVSNYSMYPTLNELAANSKEQCDVVYINKYRPLQVGDIVVANVTWNEKPVVKRLVARPFDTMRVEDLGNEYALYINDSLLYTKEKFMLHPDDNGRLYESSTYNHYVAIVNYIKAHSTTNTVTMGVDEYFLLGDNWAGSDDSSRHGTVTRSQIIGASDVVIHKGDNKINVLLGTILKGIFSF